MTDLFDDPEPVLAPPQEVQRDRWGRPLVVPPDGGKATGYTRCTTFVDVLDDKFNLTKWEKRQVAIGLAERSDLLLAVTAHRDDKQKLNGIANEAKEAAKSSASATTGTALHALTERVDAGLELPSLPNDAQRDLDAYVETTKNFEHLAIERFCVYDPFRIGGTPDRMARYAPYGEKVFVFDTKTGSIEWGALKIAMQLAVYSRSVPYNQQTDQREPWEFEIDQDWGIVAHLPAGKGECTLYWIDLAAGWKAVECAKEVRDWRKKKNWFTTFEPAAINFGQMVADATAIEDLRAIWHEANRLGQYTPDLERVCLARKAELEERAGP